MEKQKVCLLFLVLLDMYVEVINMRVTPSDVNGNHWTVLIRTHQTWVSQTLLSKRYQQLNTEFLENMKVQEQLNLSTHLTQEQLRFIHPVYFSIWTNTPLSHVTSDHYRSILCPSYNFVCLMISIPQIIQVPNLITVLFVKYFINFSQWVTYIIHASSPKPTPFFLEQQPESFQHP